MRFHLPNKIVAALIRWATSTKMDEIRRDKQALGVHRSRRQKAEGAGLVGAS